MTVVRTKAIDEIIDAIIIVLPILIIFTASFGTDIIRALLIVLTILIIAAGLYLYMGRQP